MGVVCDLSQSISARAYAAESLYMPGDLRAIPALIQALKDPEPAVRFWAVFAFGNLSDQRHVPYAGSGVVEALESMLGDRGNANPGYWSVGLEALAMLGRAWPMIDKYRTLMNAEIDRIQKDPNASKQEQDWASYYG